MREIETARTAMIVHARSLISLALPNCFDARHTHARTHAGDLRHLPL